MGKVFNIETPKNARFFIVEQREDGTYVLKVFSNETKILFEKRLKKKRKGEIHGKPHYIFEAEK